MGTGRRLAAVAAVVTLSCCGGSSESPTPVVATTGFSPESTLPAWAIGLDPAGGVDGPVMYRPRPGGPSDAEALALIGGELHLDDGCLTIGGNPVLWPFGIRWQADPPGIVYPNGSVVLLGTVVDTSGAYYGGSIADLTSAQATIDLAERCLRLTGGELVLPNPPVAVAGS